MLGFLAGLQKMPFTTGDPQFVNNSPIQAAPTPEAMTVGPMFPQNTSATPTPKGINTAAGVLANLGRPPPPSSRKGRGYSFLQRPASSAALYGPPPWMKEIDYTPQKTEADGAETKPADDAEAPDANEPGDGGNGPGGGDDEDVSFDPGVDGDRAAVGRTETNYGLLGGLAGAGLGIPGAGTLLGGIGAYADQSRAADNVAQAMKGAYSFEPSMLSSVASQMTLGMLGRSVAEQTEGFLGSQTGMNDPVTGRGTTEMPAAAQQDFNRGLAAALERAAATAAARSAAAGESGNADFSEAGVGDDSLASAGTTDTLGAGATSVGVSGGPPGLDDFGGDPDEAGGGGTSDANGDPASTPGFDDADPTNSDAATGEGSGAGDSCVIATHAVAAGAFDRREKAQAVRWCRQNLHGSVLGEAFRRGYRRAGRKAIARGEADKHYGEFRSFVDFVTGRKRTIAGALVVLRRGIGFTVSGLIHRKG